MAISVRGLSKSYTITHDREKHVTLAETMLARLKNPMRRPKTETFWALKDIEFDIKKGDVVGIIGRNGAGKSPLLKLLSRITEPTTGQIDLYGRVGSLLEVGTGFHPELTGRENVFLNGAILGMTKPEIRKQFDAIVDFAGVEQFLDTPVKRYSSGMYVRLAFAVAAHLNPEILIVDEVLSVGDAEFQKKCLGKMQDVSRNGRTVLFVSHNMNAVISLCSQGFLLDGGRLVAQGSVDQILQRYLSTTKSSSIFDLRQHPGRRKGAKPVICGISFLNEKGQAIESFRPEELMSIKFALAAESTIQDPWLSIGFNSARGERLFAVATYLSKEGLSRFCGAVEVVASFRLPSLVAGQYTLDIGLSDGPSKFIDAVYSAGGFNVVDNNYLGTSLPHFNEMGTIMVRSTWAAINSANPHTLCDQLDCDNTDVEWRAMLSAHAQGAAT